MSWRGYVESHLAENKCHYSQVVKIKKRMAILAIKLEELEREVRELISECESTESET